MKSKWLRLLTLCLLTLLLVSLPLPAFAAEGADSLPANESEESTAPPTGAEETEPAPTAEAEDPMDEDATLAALEANGYSLARNAYPDGLTAGRGYIWSAGKSFTFPGHPDKSYDALHIMAINYQGSFQTAYCINPFVNYEKSDYYTKHDWTIEDAWDDLSWSQRDAIGLVMLYGYPNGINPSGLLNQRGAQAATQLLIWEIVGGLRQATPPFTCTNTGFLDIFNSDSVGNEYTDGSSGANNGTIKNFNSVYNQIVEKLKAHRIFPSFTAVQPSAAPTHEMTRNADGTYSITLTDTNKVLSQCTFTNTANLTFQVSGNKVTITAKKAPNNETILPCNT